MPKPREKFICLLLAALLALSACSSGKTPPAAADPHAGEIEVANGFGGTMWVPLIQSLPVSALDRADFSRQGDFLTYAGSDAVSVQGVDVSLYQETVDWAQVAGAGVKFAIIRAGYRGYSQGLIYEDDYFEENLQGAAAAGLDVGAYFFSQAVDVQEARQEAEFVLNLLKGRHLDLPIFFDWEHIRDEEEGARTDAVDSETLTDCALAFAETVEAAGYQAGVYFNHSLGYFSYELGRLGSLPFWFAAAGDYSDFYYAQSYWQYSFTGEVPGIQGVVDLNLRFLPATPSPSSAESLPPEPPSPEPPSPTEGS